MAKTTREILNEIYDDYMKSLGEILQILEKIQNKVCGICPKSETCKGKKKMEKLNDRIIQTKSVNVLISLVEAKAEHINKKLFEMALLDMAKLKAVKDRGTDIPVT